MSEAAFLEISGLQKRFGATLALDDVDLNVRRGEVHAIIGENGAGKSTLMNILAASLRPDAGSITFQGLGYRPAGPLEARQRGVAHIHQELSLCSHLSVAENIFLGMEPRQRQSGWLNWRRLNDAAEELLETFHHPAITPRRRVADLPLAARQIVEICRALAQRASLILMDEPTSSLQRADVDRLFLLMRRLRDSGVSILYISHFLEEVREIADRCTVLRDGKSVASGPLQDLPNEKLITAMVGRSVSELFPARSPAMAAECVTPSQDYVLEAKNLAAPPSVREASLQLRRGEILGIAGLIGSGRTELVRTLFGLENARAGSISVFGQLLPIQGTPETRIARGVGYLSEDRKGEGLAPSLSVTDNITFTNFASCSRRGWIDLSKQREQAQEWADAVEVRAATMDVAVQKLSGGNQQKAVIARLLHQGCEIFLLDEPTRGVDVVSKAQIYGLIVGLARSGKAILMVSSYLPELFGICDRLAVMSRGHLSRARPIVEWTPESVLETAIGSS
jgi:ribose transport system ATP-binding protein